MTDALRARLGAAFDILVALGGVALIAIAGAALNVRSIPMFWRLLLGEPLAMAVLLAVTTWLLAGRGRRWADLGLAWPASWKRTAGLVAAGLLAAYLGNGVIVLPLDHVLHLAPPDLKAVAPVVGTPSGYAFMLALTWTTVAFGEEMLFRGFLTARLETLFGAGRPAAGLAWLAQGVLFGLMHSYQGAGGVLTTAWVGLALGGVRLAARRNLAACIVLHGLIDTIGLTAVFFVLTHGLKLP